MPRNDRVRRRALSCARCRKRKIKCDSIGNSCSMCLSAGVYCMALDIATNETAPRSIIRYLEDQIAQLEAQMLGSPSTCTSKSSGSNSKDSILGGTLACGDLHVSPSLGLTSNVPLPPNSISPTEIPVARGGLFGISDLDESHPRSILNPRRPKQLNLSAIPLHIAEFLFQTYVRRIIPQYPIFHTTQVERAFDECFVLPGTCADAGEPSRRSVYIVSIIAAISLSTAARNKRIRAQAIAASLVRSAVLYAPEVLTNDLMGLQCLLLLIQYTFLDPNVANLWLLTGLSSEACIDLGLHRDCEDETIDALDRDMRRRVFWCAYEMEIAVCAGLQRQLRLLAKDVSMCFPSEYSDQAITRAGIDGTGMATKFISRRIWSFRIIETGVLEMLYQNHSPLSGDFLDQWMAKVEMDILCWTQEVHHTASQNQNPVVKSQWAEIELYADIAYAWVLVLMYRPCPALKARKREHIMKAFDAGVKVATGYFTQANRGFGFLKYVFHPCHHSFASALVFLQALKYCKEEVSDLYSLDEVQEYFSCFSRFFAAIAERWPAASHCLNQLGRLWEPIRNEYTAFLLQKEHLALAALEYSEVSSTGAENAGDMAEVFDLWPVFNPTSNTAGDGTRNTGAAIPFDWHAEFEFEAETLNGTFV